MSGEERSERPKSPETPETPEESRVVVERRGHVMLVGLNRPAKRNAADLAMLTALFRAFGEADADDDVRAVVVHARGAHFTAGLDLADVAGRLGPDGLELEVPGGRDPWRIRDAGIGTPVVVAVQGICYTLGIELILAADIAVAADDASFAQLEVARGILPFGGATLRFPRAAGWGDAMRWMLTGDAFDAAEAHRIGLVQEVVPPDRLLERAVELAGRIAEQAPLAVRATLANARRAISDPAGAGAELGPQLARLAASEDAAIGMQAFLARTRARFVGR